jgi:hypothetical protein
MAEMHQCTLCGAVAGPAQMQLHMDAKHGTPSSRMYGAPHVNVLGKEKPASTLQPGARVQFDHQGQTHTGTVWSEAPNMPADGSRGKGVPHRHVIPDGWRDTIPLPAKQLIQIASPMESSRNGEFHTAVAPTMPGQDQLGLMHNWHAEGRGPVGG